MSPPPISRRQALKLGAAAVAASALPTATSIVESIAAPETRPLLPAFVVGTPGEYDWEFIRAATEDEAIIQWLEQSKIAVTDECEAETCRCKDWRSATACEHFGQPDIEANRAEALDAIENPTPGDWMRAGFGYECSRCRHETHADDGGRGVGDEAVCEDCMTLADWEIVDPERARDMREEMEDDA